MFEIKRDNKIPPVATSTRLGSSLLHQSMMMAPSFRS